MNSLKNQYVLDMNRIDPNIFNFKEHQVNQFYKHGSKELKLKHVQDDRKHRFYYKGVLIGGTNGLKPLSTSRSAFIICKDKIKTERLLTKNSIPTLNSGYFKVHEKELAKQFIVDNELQKVVIKPLSLAGGKGIELGVDINTFDDAWDRSIIIQKELGIENPSCIIQRYIDGFDVRIAITEGIYSSAILRVPAYVVGDGVRTIEELIDEKNMIRKQSLYFKRFLYKIDDNIIKKLEQQDLTIQSVLEKDMLIFISDLGNLTAGAESIDITDEVSEYLIDIAMRATAAVPGLRTAGVDILTDDFTSNEGFISEVNTNANHQVHHLPFKGEIRKPFRDIIFGMLIRFKLENGYILNANERKKSKDLMRFIQYKEYYHNNTYRFYMKEFLEDNNTL